MPLEREAIFILVGRVRQKEEGPLHMSELREEAPEIEQVERIALLEGDRQG